MAPSAFSGDPPRAMKTLRLFFFSLSIIVASCAQDSTKEWSAIFSGGKGNRIDFTPKNGGLQVGEDAASVMYRFDIPNSGNKATLGLMPMKSALQSNPEIYELEVLQRSDEMIVMKVKLAPESRDRFQIFTIFPKTGIGFCTTVSAYINGTKETRAASAVNPNIPPASAVTTSLFRMN